MKREKLDPHDWLESLKPTEKQTPELHSRVESLFKKISEKEIQILLELGRFSTACSDGEFPHDTLDGSGFLRLEIASAYCEMMTEKCGARIIDFKYQSYLDNPERRNQAKKYLDWYDIWAIIEEFINTHITNQIKTSLALQSMANGTDYNYKDFRIDRNGKLICRLSNSNEEE